MLTSAPWINAPNIPEIFRAGAGLGLEARGQDVVAQEAGQRLRLSYDTLAAEQEARRQEAAQRAQQINATLALKAGQQDAMSLFRQQQADLNQQKVLDTERRLGDLEKGASDRLLHQESQPLSFDKEDYSKMAERINSIQKELDTLGPMTPDEDEPTRIKRAAFANEIASLHRKMAAIKNPPQPAASAPVAAPLINRVNGVAVPQFDSTENMVGDQSVGDYLSRLNGAPETRLSATNQPPTVATSAPPVGQRPLGMKLTTAKGTFTWNGTGWDRVE
jgi:hypothetical protein